MQTGRWIGCRRALVALLAGCCSLGWAQAQSSDEAATEPGSATGKQSVTVPLSGTATERRIGNLSISPSVFDTGLVEIGQSSRRMVTLTHVGGVDADPVRISQAQLFGANKDEYQSELTGDLVLYSGDSRSFQITFTPTVPGIKSAGLKLQLEQSSSPYVLLFKGQSRYPLTSALIVELDTLDVGSVIQNQTKKATLSVSNDGEPDAPPIVLADAQISGADPTAFSSDFQPATLQPGDTLEIEITLSSGVPGSKNAQLVLLHDGSNDTVSVALQGAIIAPTATAISFDKSTLKNASVTRGTALQFGPDGKLYVTEMNGVIKVFDVNRSGKNNYTGQLLETITSLLSVPNHNDDGTAWNGANQRLVTGLYVTGTAAAPEIYVASSDPRQGGGPNNNNDKNTDTNSGILHKLTKSGNNWTRQDLVRGLPRSKENHAPNGLLMKDGKILLLIGGHTNEGLPSHNFVDLPEYALSAALLEIDVDAINGTYDLPTLDDEDRPGVDDAADPFGGNNGKNQAILEANGPVKLYYSGLRNAYDIIETEAGKLYTFDNGPNQTWGGKLGNNCTNDILEGGTTHWDNLHLVTRGGYGGHPNPTRGNKANTFNESNPQTPIQGADHPEECEYLEPGEDGTLLTIPASSNGMTEYTTMNFGGAMLGDLLVATFKKYIQRIELNDAGTQVTSSKVLFSNLGNAPLDIVAASPDDPFPGTLWVVDNLTLDITVFEPEDYDTYVNF